MALLSAFDVLESARFFSARLLSGWQPGGPEDERRGVIGRRRMHILRYCCLACCWQEMWMKIDKREERPIESIAYADFWRIDYGRCFAMDIEANEDFRRTEDLAILAMFVRIKR